MAWMEEVAPQPQPSLRRICGPGEALTGCLLRAAILDPAPTPHQQLMLVIEGYTLALGSDLWSRLQKMDGDKSEAQTAQIGDKGWKVFWKQDRHLDAFRALPRYP